MQNTLVTPHDEQHQGQSRDRESGNSLIKRRARKACVECHDKKVRCDILVNGSPCTNCRLDKLNCQLRARQPRRKLNVTDKSTEPNFSRGSSERSAITPGQDHTPYDDTNSPILSPETVPTVSIPPWSISPIPRIANPGLPELLYSYYDFIEAESMSHIAPDDFTFLEQKRCFHLPARKVLNECMRQYFLHVHPLLPLIDEKYFWELYLTDNKDYQRSKKISLFVLRAMMFASSSYLPTNTLRALGFETHTKAQHAMYQRTKLLFDFKMLSDPLSLAQGALLLSLHHTERDPLANTTWLRVAIQYATSIDAHQYDNYPTFSLDERLARKRLWWSCMLRDRVQPLGLRRPIQITRQIFDFSQSPLSESELIHECHHSQVYDHFTKLTLLRNLLAFFDLAIKLTDVISLVYPGSGYRSFEQNGFGGFSKTLSQLEHCRGALNWWLRSTQGGLNDLELDGPQRKAVLLFFEITQIYCNSARLALCQHEVLTVQTFTPDSSLDRRKELGSEIHAAVSSIAQSVKGLVRSDMARYLPLSIVAYLALPIVLTAYDVNNDPKSNSHPEIEAQRRNFEAFNEAMKVSLSRYPAAETATNIYNRAVATARNCNKNGQPSNWQSDAYEEDKIQEITTWYGMLVSQPLRYLRFTMTIDLCLNNGKYTPPESLSRQLQIMNVSTTSQPSHQTPLTVLDELAYVVEQQNGARITDPSLAFLDFESSVSGFDEHQEFSMINHST